MVTSTNHNIEDSIINDIHYIFITPDQYIKFIKKNPSSVQDCTFIPPHIGENHFGKFKVRISHFYGTHR